MFLPNTDSFVLIRRMIVRPRFPVFLPNTDSFLLRRKRRKAIIVEPEFTPEAGTPRSAIAELTPVSSPTGVGAIPQSTDSEQPKVNDQDKRNFLKVAGIVGAGIAGSLLLPKKAEALIMGSSPTTGVVGVKNATNARINPATEETVSSILEDTSGLTFDTGSLNVKVTSPSSFSVLAGTATSGLVDAQRHVQVDVLSSALPTGASTETTLQTISTENTLETISFGGVKYDLRMETDGYFDYIGEASELGALPTESKWRIKRIDNADVAGKPSIIIRWANNDAVSNKIWNNRASYFS